YHMEIIIGSGGRIANVRETFTRSTNKSDLRRAIFMHNRAIKLTHLLEESYHQIALVLQVGCVLMLALGSHYILNRSAVLLKKIVTGCIVGGSHLILMIMNWLGQKIIDSGDELLESLYATNWYLASPKDRKDLSFIMQRSQRLPFLTAGKLTILSMESFAQ
ncbi:hypothetical protein QAD02_005103, partial [Eretmocerus hayati]